MDHNRFDDLTRAMAVAPSRRQFVKTVLGGIAGGLLASLGLGQAQAGGGNNDCAKFCAQVFGANTPEADKCTSDAAHGQGLCYECGPKSDHTKTLCGKTCVNTKTDTANCGSCGHTCTAPANGSVTCTSGSCVSTCNAGYKLCNGSCIPNDQCCGGCPTGQTCCNGTTCVNTSTDTSNCGSCGHTCTAPANGSVTCTSGSCVSTCNAGYKLCNGSCIPNDQCCGGCPAGQTCCNGTTCVNANTDPANCGACGHTCTAPANASATCSGGNCGFTCNAGYKLCNGSCIANDQCCGGCPAGKICCNGVCSDSDCPCGRVKISNGTCVTPCNGFGDCPGSRCAEDISGQSYCWQGEFTFDDTCSDDSGCAQGYFCYFFGNCIQAL